VEEIDARDRVVTPGWVDIHTHYDGQVLWESSLSPSCFHGVTTMVIGNCGVGFAPVDNDQHDLLIALMEGVEDIPAADPMSCSASRGRSALPGAASSRWSTTSTISRRSSNSSARSRP
jgi:N-acyl-D-aspartate/D-glutamate deacylase